MRCSLAATVSVAILFGFASFAAAQDGATEATKKANAALRE